MPVCTWDSRDISRREFGAANHVGLGVFAKENHITPRRAAQHGHLSGRHFRRSDLRDGKGGLRTVLSKAVWEAFQRAVALGRREKVG